MSQNLFISHSSQDDEFVKSLRESLTIHGFEPWVDSRNLVASDALEPKILKAIESADAFILVFSLTTINSAWVAKELQYAHEIKKSREDYRIVPLLMNGADVGSLKFLFPDEPVGIKIDESPSGLANAMPQLLAALGARKADDLPGPVQVKAEPLEELILELREPTFQEVEGKRRASATATLKYIPAQSGQRSVESEKPFDFEAPMGPIEMDELKWYLESYYLWPVGVFRDRAKGVEDNLKKWGQDLYQQALPLEYVLEVLKAWDKVDKHAKRRFTILVKDALKASASDEAKAEAKEAATTLLSLPWELLHDPRGFLFQGAKAVRVRRQLPTVTSLDTMVAEAPIRILLVSPRPEEKGVGYIDHRASALPLVDALETLGDLAELTVLHPPTFQAMENELTRAHHANKPYHVVHFDGHGVYNPEIGLGALCFEDPSESDKLAQRGAQIIDAQKLAETMRDHRIPLVFLEACQSAQAKQDPTTSVAARLLNEGVASVIAMSHSVLVETARRFVQKFYESLIEGERVGEAMLDGQRALKQDTFRLKIFGAGKLHLEDWFVPVLYQEKEDPQLFKQIPSEQVKAIGQKAQKIKQGELPPAPEHSFIGRSRDLLKLERLLSVVDYAVICGQGGEGKTTLAVELARWLFRSSRFDRVVFVCVENHQQLRSIVDQVGKQLLSNYSVPQFEGDAFQEALQPISRELENHRTLLLFDNMESLLPPPSANSSEAELFHDPELLEGFLKLCQKLNELPHTRLLFTSRETLPEPFHHPNRTLHLSRLEKEPAIKLVKEAMTAAGLSPQENDRGDTQPEIEALVESVNCHARSLTLLAPQIHQFGVQQTTESLVELMRAMDQKAPNNREKSLFASLELSLRRLPEKFREKLPRLGLFHGGGHLVVIGQMLEFEKEALGEFVGALLQTGLAQLGKYNHLRFHPALCPYLYQQLAKETCLELQQQWGAIMLPFVEFLYEQQFQEAQLAASLALLELPNLLALLHWIQTQGEAEAKVDLATTLEGLLQNLGRPRALKRVVAIRESATEKLGDWGHMRFEATRSQIERLLEQGNLPEALNMAEALLKQTLQAGESVYGEAEYDTAMAFATLGKVLQMAGVAAGALEKAKEAEQRFQKLANQGNHSAAGMVSVCLAEQADCLVGVGQLDQAAETCQRNIELADKLGDHRQVAVGTFQLGTVRLLQKEYKEALEAYESARKTFKQLGELQEVATAWHQIGMVYQKSNEFEPAEKAYRQSMAIKIQQNNLSGESSSLNQLGNLYSNFGRLEEAVTFYKQSADIDFQLDDLMAEGRSRSNLADKLIRLNRLDEAHQEIQRAIECVEPFGHAGESWKAWHVLHNLEQAESNPEAARQARDKAVEAFLSYRRDGGENHEVGGRLSLMLGQALQAGETQEVESLLEQWAESAEVPEYLKPMVSALQAILKGSRDWALVENPELWFDDVVELRLLLESLEA